MHQDAAIDFEKYKLTIEVCDGANLQLVRDVNTGVETWQVWQRRRYLGRGAFGEVWQEGWEDDHGDWHYRAVKSSSDAGMRAAKIDYQRELLALIEFSKFECASWFVNLHGWWLDNGVLSVAMEYLGRGDLSRYTGSEITDVDAKDIVENILRGLEVMHHHGFTHRDIKPQNILVVQKRPEFHRWWVKIADFGISKQIAVDSDTALHSVVGTRPYCAPEILGYLEQYQETSIYSNKVDIWSLGCVLFNIGSRGQLPFSELDLVKYCARMVELNPKRYPVHLSEEGISFIRYLLQVDPKDRPTATEALQHTWFSNRRSNTKEPDLSKTSAVSAGEIANYNSFLNSDLSTTSSVAKDLANLTIRAGTASHAKKDSSTGSDHVTMASVKRMVRELNSPSLSVLKDPGPNDRKSVDSVAKQMPTQPGTRDFDAKAAMEKWLTENEEELQVYEDTERPPLFMAMEQNRQDIAEHMVRQGADIKVRDSMDWTLLHAAAYTGDRKLIKWLVDLGVHVNAKNETSVTPLHVAACSGNLDAVECLIELGATLNARDDEGDTPLHAAAAAGKLSTVEYLQQRGADIKVLTQGARAYTPLHSASTLGYLDMVKWLVEHGISINAKDHSGRVPLHYAVCGENLDIVKWLVEQDADLEETDNKGNNLLDYVDECEDRSKALEIESFLRDYIDGPQAATT